MKKKVLITIITIIILTLIFILVDKIFNKESNEIILNYEPGSHSYMNSIRSQDIVYDKVISRLIPFILSYVPFFIVYGIAVTKLKIFTQNKDIIYILLIFIIPLLFCYCYFYAGYNVIKVY